MIRIIIVSSQAYIMSLKSEILPVTALSSFTSIASYHEILTMTSSLPTATATLNNNTPVTVLVSSVIGAALIVVLILLTITVTIRCTIIYVLEKGKQQIEGMYKLASNYFYYVKLSIEGTITNNPAYGKGM